MNRYDKKYKSFYNTEEWKNLRAWKFGQANGCCEMCKRKGMIIEGKQVHHIVPIEEDWSKRLDPDNLELLCIRCHNEVHMRTSPLQDFERFWDLL